MMRENYAIPYSDYVDTLTPCVMDKFDLYATRCDSIFRWTTLFSILLTTASSVTQVPATAGISSVQISFQSLSIVAFVCSVTSTCIMSVVHVFKFHKVADACRSASASILRHRTSKRPISSHELDIILKTNTLWFPHPTRCVFKRRIQPNMFAPPEPASEPSDVKHTHRFSHIPRTRS